MTEKPLNLIATLDGGLYNGSYSSCKSSAHARFLCPI